ncbi:short-chain dehydrogenase/reductase [Marispirochaeta aestuarii]|uniref:Short-chain dehydrogenase/reductase n=1 Tax=Marispirochaeta aestuarii TaxID=1963862 RepID=A0A1Y1RWG4_9SPIO|nr:oxidoreductase [Marispirochaeta aestuarii]ORC32995.1 short-chain dehydrogenase/reductase [Marispirochaeta aestuarii]
MAETRRTALITGASSGMGKETALALIQAGYDVYGAARRINQMADIVTAGGHSLELDITDEKSIVSAVTYIEEAAGGIDILINNAGYGCYGAVEDVPLAEARRQFEVNLFGLAHITRLVLPGMRKRGYGKIVNISSIGGKIYMPMGAWYHASKHAVEGFSDALRFEARPFGIDVIIIEPGLIQTHWSGIATDNMLTYSGGTAYDSAARKTTEMFRGLEGSDPRTVARIILKAISARKPRSRYAVGKYARPLLTLRKILPDRTYDWLLRKRIGK